MLRNIERRHAIDRAEICGNCGNVDVRIAKPRHERAAADVDFLAMAARPGVTDGDDPAVGDFDETIVEIRTGVNVENACVRDNDRLAHADIS